MRSLSATVSVALLGCTGLSGGPGAANPAQWEAYCAGVTNGWREVGDPDCLPLLRQRRAQMAQLQLAQQRAMAAQPQGWASTQADAQRRADADSRAQFERDCIDKGGKLWAARMRSDAAPHAGACPEPDDAFAMKWGRHATPAIVERMTACVGHPRPFAECEAEVAPDFDAEHARRRAAVPATGVFDWSEGKYGKGGDCEMAEDNRLTLSIDDWGDAEWLAFTNADARCDSGQNVPVHCGRHGLGYVDTSSGAPRLITARRGQVGGGELADPTIAVWQCGALVLHMPMSWKAPSECRRLGSVPTRSAEIASEVSCQLAEIFPELNESGVELRASGDAISFAHRGKQITLTRRAGNAPPGRTVEVPF